MNSLVDRRVPADILHDAEMFRKLRKIAEQSLSAGIEIKTERLNGVKPHVGEEVRFYYYLGDTLHMKEAHGRTLDKVVEAMPIA